MAIDYDGQAPYTELTVSVWLLMLLSFNDGISIIMSDIASFVGKLMYHYSQ
jgi:hypothetical protein